MFELSVDGPGRLDVVLSSSRGLGHVRSVVLGFVAAVVDLILRETVVLRNDWTWRNAIHQSIIAIVEGSRLGEGRWWSNTNHR